MEKNSKKVSIGNYLGFQEVLGYFFRKKDPSRPININLKMMHGINKLSILMFLAGMTYLIIKSLAS